MATPAINRSESQYVEARRYTEYPDESVPSPPVSRLYRASSRIRPASSSSPFVLPGRRMPTNWTHDSSRWTLPLFSVAEPPQWWGYSRTTNNYAFSYGSPSVGPFDFNLERKAINGCLEKLKLQHVDFSVAFLERKKTKQLFADVAKDISSDVDRFKRKNGSLWDKIKSINPRKESYPRAWLALQYGFKPAVDDLTGLLIALNEHDQLPKSYYTTVTKTSKGGEKGTVRSDLMYYGGLPEYPLLCRQDVDELCHVSLTYSLDNPVLQALSAFGITNPFSTSWELLPYSFVLDWAVPVGDYLNLLDSDFGWTYQMGSVGRLKKVSIQGTGLILPNGHVRTSGDPSEYSYKADSFSRHILYNSPWPVFPGLKNPLTPTHVANALALLTSAYR